MPIPQVSDTIHLSDVHAGDANAGNGADGYNYGNINYNPSAVVANTQSVAGATVDVHSGDSPWLSASWDAGHAGHGGGADAANGFLANITNHGDGGAGGDANSNGSLGSSSGGNVGAATADTSAVQYTELLADQHATILAGVGGNGGNGNMARGGDISAALVHSNPETHTTTTTTNDIASFANSFNDNFHDIDLSHMPI
ncbi:MULTISPECIES: PE-PGRS family protein [unclassified Ochrobactrum]|uniref:PE-PGRS family protein n=1 Tax=unclassified Ochrobactrum TaxID=239106 RepID=UPI0015FD46EA|nr:hypothetical protein [Ochrobactrum sp. RH2CCR150]MDH7787498.1 hypothetical protein [Ochrobactrum sp. 19YEA23]